MSTLQGPPDVATFARLLIPGGSGHVVELRALGVPLADNRTGTCAGFFDDPHVLAVSAARLDEQGASGVYVTLNPVRPELLERAKNRIDLCPRSLTKDYEVCRRRLILIDCDPVRPPGVSATDEEKGRAKAVAERILTFLRQHGINARLRGDSGNGYHIIIEVDLPVDDGGLVREFLGTLARHFDTEHVTIDRSVANASRITKFFGTKARKGTATADRPHRRSSILSLSDAGEPTPVALLESVVAQSTPRAPRTRNQVGHRAGRSNSADAGRIRSALLYIPADDREVWLRVGMALQHDLPEAEGWALWTEWSQTSSKFDHREQEKAWMSFKNDHANPVTLGTVYVLAREHGWNRCRNRLRRGRVVYLRMDEV